MVAHEGAQRHSLRRRGSASLTIAKRAVRGEPGFVRRVTRLRRSITLAKLHAERNSNLQFKVRFQLLSPCRREITAQPNPILA
jgi:hypothetical protein